jgi:hypothetical protein
MGGGNTILVKSNYLAVNLMSSETVPGAPARPENIRRHSDQAPASPTPPGVPRGARRPPAGRIGGGLDGGRERGGAG